MRWRNTRAARMTRGFSSGEGCLYNDNCKARVAAVSSRAWRPVIDGPVAQLGERLVRNEEASGSIPLRSTNFSITYISAKPELSHKTSQLNPDLD